MLKPRDFEFGDLLGEGAYSRVILAEKKATGEQYAVKVMEKRHILKEKKQAYVKMERDILNMLQHPNIVELKCTFQDVNCLYFVLEYCKGGELFELLKELGTLSEPLGKFYGAEIINAVRHMHSLNIIHRDLKPENILLSESGHIKLTDFGTARKVEDGGTRNTFCGTAEYVSPEVLQDKGATQSSDLWALGCIFYQFFAGKVPFRGESEYLTFQLILSAEYVFPTPFPADAEDLVKKLIVLDPTKRLGAGPLAQASEYQNLIQHPFFKDIEFSELHEQTPPPRRPYIEKRPLSAPKSSSPFPASASQKFVAEDERILHEGLVVKKRGLFSNKKRQLLLTSQGRLVYVDLGKQIVKGAILLSQNTRPVLKNQREFVIQTPGRNYYFEDATAAAEIWINKIRAAMPK